MSNKVTAYHMLAAILLIIMFGVLGFASVFILSSFFAPFNAAIIAGSMIMIVLAVFFIDDMTRSR